MSGKTRRHRRMTPFNPHRSRRSGAMLLLAIQRGRDSGLSILTAPEGAVQFPRTARAESHALLSILTAPEGAVQCRRLDLFPREA